MSGFDMTDDEFAAAFLGGVQGSERDETLDQVEQFKRSRPEAVSDLRASIEADRHDQLDSAEWIARQLVDLLSRGDRRLDHEWAAQVRRCLRVLGQHFDAGTA